MREEQNIVRPDLIHLLMLARNGKLTDENDKSVKRGHSNFSLIK